MKSIDTTTIQESIELAKTRAAQELQTAQMKKQQEDEERAEIEQALQEAKLLRQQREETKEKSEGMKQEIQELGG